MFLSLIYECLSGGELQRNFAWPENGPPFSLTAIFILFYFFREKFCITEFVNAFLDENEKSAP